MPLSSAPPLFSTLDYKVYLNDVVESAPRGFITKLAEAAPCQRSYLSKVLSGDIHITTDQAFNISRFLQHSELEENYFFSMVEYARASTRTYKEHLKNKLEKLKQENEDLSKRLQRSVVSFSEKEAFYYSSFIPSCIHILVSIPQYQTPQSISMALRIPLSIVQNTLDQLEKFELVKKEKDRYAFKGSSLHVSKTSPYVLFHHQNWRQQANLNAQKYGSENLHYTNVQSMSREAYEKTKLDLLHMIQRAAEISGPSKEQILVGFLTDLFVVA